VGASVAETRAYIDERVGVSDAGTRRHFDVVGESLRSEIRVAPSIEKMNGRIGEQTGRGDGLEGRVLRLEARVLSLEDDRKPRRPRRQR